MVVQESLELWVALIVTTGFLIWVGIAFPTFFPAPLFWICVILCVGCTIYVMAKVALLVADMWKDLRRKPGQKKQEIEWYNDNTVIRFFKGMADIGGSRKLSLARPQVSPQVVVCMQKLNAKLEPDKPRQEVGEELVPDIERPEMGSPIRSYVPPGLPGKFFLKE